MIHLHKEFDKLFYKVFKNPLTFVAFIIVLAAFAIFAPVVIPAHLWISYIIPAMFIFMPIIVLFVSFMYVQDIYLIIKSRPKDWKPNYCKECGHIISEKDE